MKLFLSLPLLALAFTACTHGNCRAIERKEKPTATEAAAMTTPSSSLQKIKISKPDGSLQCGQGKAVPLADMQKELKGIQVFSSANKNDGMMRIQVCGSPTGNHNVYEIDRKDLDAALKAGFKEWMNE